MSKPLDEGPFFHGTKANLRDGDLLRAGFRSNYRPEVVMNHIYFTALPNGAGLRGRADRGIRGRPERDRQEFPGNPTQSYRSNAPLRVVLEVTDWTRQAPEALQVWKERLAALRADERGQIIN